MTLRKTLKVLSAIVIAALGGCSALNEGADVSLANAAQPSFALVSDADHEDNGSVHFVRIPSGDCSNVTSTPIVVGDYVLLPMHDQGRNCPSQGKYARSLLGYRISDGQVYVLQEDASTEGTLLYQRQENRVFWPVTFGGSIVILDDALNAVDKVQGLKATVDSSGTYLDGVFYFGTINTPEPNCQEPLNKDCGAVYGMDAHGNILHRLDVDDGFRTWVAAGITTDGKYLYVGGSEDKGNAQYLYGCSSVKLDASLNIVASADPGDQGCHRSGQGGNDEDAVAGELSLGPDSVWVQYTRPSDARDQVAVIRYDRDLVEQCRVEFEADPALQSISYYQGPTIDQDGNAYVTITVPAAGRTRNAQLVKITPQCQATTLADVPDSKGQATPTLADDQYVLFATAGKLSVYTLEGQLYREFPLASEADVLSSPIIHEGVIYVLAADGALTIIRESGVQGYGNAIWPRFRHDNDGSGSLIGG